jgi:hypothetical protein
VLVQHKTVAKPETVAAALIAKVAATIEAQHAMTLIAKARAAIEAQNVIARRGR